MAFSSGVSWKRTSYGFVCSQRRKSKNGGGTYRRRKPKARVAINCVVGIAVKKGVTYFAGERKKTTIKKIGSGYLLREGVDSREGEADWEKKCKKKMAASRHMINLPGMGRRFNNVGRRKLNT